MLTSLMIMRITCGMPSGVGDLLVLLLPLPLPLLLCMPATYRKH
jgi:hypothetical protein